MWKFWMNGDEKPQGDEQKPEPQKDLRGLDPEPNPAEESVVSATPDSTTPDVVEVPPVEESKSASGSDSEQSSSGDKTENASDDLSTAGKEVEGEEKAEEPAKKEPRRRGNSRRNGVRKPKQSKSSKVKAEEKDLEESEEDEVVSNNAEEGSDDPLGEAYCLDDGSLINEPGDEVLPWRSDVKSPKEFFSTEILYRYDILEDNEQTALKGSYRLELKGSDGGVWSIDVTNELSVENTKKDAEIVISMNRKDFMNVVNGRLNPQLAILAQKIKLEGYTRRAVIFQSLLAPTPE